MPGTTPSSLGFRMPPEWFPHESTWLAWPKNQQTWPGRVAEIQDTYLRMITVLSSGERVDLLVDDAETESRVRDQLGVAEAGRVMFHHIESADAWIRDYGPNFVLQQSTEHALLAFNHWGFNAWGGRYAELVADGKIPERLESTLGLRRFLPGRVLEGGAIEVNGRDTCLASQKCLLNDNRNPDCPKSEMEALLRDHIGASQILWLEGGIEGDDTDGHVDNLARFVDPRTIVCVLEDDPLEANYEPLRNIHRYLKAAHDGQGCPFKIVSLPMPGRWNNAGPSLPASYANFYIANRVVLVPVFASHNDTRALTTLQELFPDREVVGIDCRAIVWGLGGLHCLTQQQPKRVAGRW